MNKIFRKLRHYNKQYYFQFLFCTTLAITLITSFSTLLFSPTIQLVLPAGGDSRMQITMIFVIDIIACLAFIEYSEGLFLKYKSKEMGIFLALGITKKNLKKALSSELRLMVVGCAFIGVVLGGIISVLIWKVFCLFFKDMDSVILRLSTTGFVIGIIFSVFSGIRILAKASKYMKKANLLDLLNASSKSEPLRATSYRYGIMGVILTLLGIILGYAVPVIVSINFNKLLPGIWKVSYLFSPVGIYMIFVYAVGCHKRGKSPKKYYNNLILYSTMKFQGKQTVRNMCVLTLMVAASLFAVFYPMNILVSRQEAAKNPIDFSIPYKLSENEITKRDIYEIAKDYNMEIVNYQDMIFSELLGGLMERDKDENGKLYTEFIEKDKYCEFINGSTYNKVTGKNVDVPAGGYYYIIAPDTSEGYWEKNDDLKCVTNPVTEEKLTLTYSGTTENLALYGVGTWKKRYVLNDMDYERITSQLPKEHMVMQILFNVKDRKESFQFSKAIYNEIINRASQDMAVCAIYDEWQEKNAAESGKNYDYGDRLELTLNNGDLMYDWKYYPYITLYIENTFLRSAVVYFLLFSYVALICLVAVGVIAYTRAITIGLNCNKLFMDLRKLGANNAYIERCVNSQLSKIFILPTIIGSILMYIFKLIMTYGNDRYLSNSEVRELGVDILVILGVSLYMYIVYRMSLKKVKGMIGF